MASVVASPENLIWEKEFIVNKIRRNEKYRGLFMEEVSWNCLWFVVFCLGFGVYGLWLF